jgi:hypothetical protein
VGKADLAWVSRGLAAVPLEQLAATRTTSLSCASCCLAAVQQNPGIHHMWHSPQ